MLDEIIDRLSDHNISVADLAISHDPETGHFVVAVVIDIPNMLPPAKLQEAMLVSLLQTLEPKTGN